LVALHELNERTGNVAGTKGREQKMSSTKTERRSKSAGFASAPMKSVSIRVKEEQQKPDKETDQCRNLSCGSQHPETMTVNKSIKI
jgi:hypothetical protein